MEGQTKRQFLQEAVNRGLNMFIFNGALESYFYNESCEAATLESRMQNKYLKMEIIWDP